MNTRPSSLLALASVLTTFAFTPVSAATFDAPARVFRVTTVERNDETIIERGTTLLTVRQLLGAPACKLDRATWVYYRFQALRGRPASEECQTLILTFSEGRVVEIMLINDSAEKQLVAQLHPKSSEQVQVAAK